MALVGNLKDLKLPNLVQINCMEKNTAKLTLEHAGKYGFIYFQDGLSVVLLVDHDHMYRPVSVVDRVQLSNLLD